MNLSSKGVRTTVGVPGTGMSWSKQSGWAGASDLKAVESFEGGRGPSVAKFQTLTKRFDTAMAGYQKVDDAVADQRVALAAIVSRLNGMSFGMFGGKLKSAKKDLLTLAREHGDGARQLTDAVNRLRGEVSNELATAGRST
ncbi:hypothetical protein MNBD_ALPHA07-1543 [hydrothermal vent metagenome]|uniref:Uncharacterized protein n=1 Tax=hydrothermal vent metagenome TaxID=652676 RepID=A0A3B0RSF8_9ZZZZ